MNYDYFQMLELHILAMSMKIIELIEMVEEQLTKFLVIFVLWCFKGKPTLDQLPVVNKMTSHMKFKLKDLTADPSLC